MGNLFRWFFEVTGFVADALTVFNAFSRSTSSNSAQRLPALPVFLQSFLRTEFGAWLIATYGLLGVALIVWRLADNGKARTEQEGWEQFFGWQIGASLILFGAYGFVFEKGIGETVVYAAIAIAIVTLVSRPIYRTLR